MRDATALGPGPSPSSVFLVDADGPNLRVLDLATGQEYRPIKHANDVSRPAYGRYVMYEARNNTNGG